MIQLDRGFGLLAHDGQRKYQTKMKMTTEIPESILTPDKVETSLGTFEFFDGFPTEATAQKCYDYIDTARAVEVFL